MKILCFHLRKPISIVDFLNLTGRSNALKNDDYDDYYYDCDVKGSTAGSLPKNHAFANTTKAFFQL